MLNKKQARKDLVSASTKLENIRLDLARKEAEYNSAKEAHAKNVAATAGRQRYPKSLSVQRDSLMRLNIEIEGLERALEIAESAVKEAENRLHLAELYETVKSYKKAELIYFENAEDLISAVQELNAMVDKLCASVGSFLQTENPVAILKGLLNQPVVAGLSLKRFFDGEIAEETAGENGHFLDQLAIRYARISRSLPDAKTAHISLETLADHFDSINREANSLVPRQAKYIPAQMTPTRAENNVQSGQVLPRHAMGGTEVDAKDDPRSDYWFHRRRALQKVKDATTVLGKKKT